MLKHSQGVISGDTVFQKEVPDQGPELNKASVKN